MQTLVPRCCEKLRLGQVAAQLNAFTASLAPKAKWRSSPQRSRTRTRASTTAAMADEKPKVRRRAWPAGVPPPPNPLNRPRPLTDP